MSYIKIDNAKEINRFGSTVRVSDSLFDFSINSVLTPDTVLPNYTNRFCKTRYYKRKCRRNNNVAPILDLNGVGVGLDLAGTYFEYDPSTLFLEDSVLTDENDTDLSSLSMVGSGDWGADGTDEIIRFATWETDADTDKTENLVVGGTTFSIEFVASSSTLTATKSGGGVFPIEDGQELIRLFEYENTAIPPTVGDRIFEWTANDGTDDSLVASLTLTVEQLAEIYRVRRTSDSTESDVNLIQVDNGVLDSFVGVGDGAVTTWYDSSGNNNDVTQSTTTLQPKVAVSGTVQEGVVFDGSNDYLPLTVADVTLAGASSATLCGWFRVSSLAATRCLFQEATSTSGFARFSVRVTSGGIIQFYTRDATADPSGTINELLSLSPLSVDTWYHIACVYTTNSKKVYINGVLDNSSTPTTGVFGSSTSNGIRLGSTDAGTQFHAGSMSDIRIYRGTALDISQVGDAMAGGEVGSPLLWLKGNYDESYYTSQNVYQKYKDQVYQRDDSLVLERA